MGRFKATVAFAVISAIFFIFVSNNTTQINDLLALLLVQLLTFLVYFTHDIISHVNDKFNQLEKSNDELNEKLDKIIKGLKND